ncbi:MAG: hypothetical protein KDK04_15620 [Candidatus Competibacteraceae bacterium]|nr:hypothetical protein [Candidatus Competibacteraceae bacterium]MCB1806179.1 hypothetical protein [Candidatus Competibacteraceae bacterium]MCB1813128.1 hypothetical protein [Candidatus Competibacteraceae bacterium]
MRELKYFGFLSLALTLLMGSAIAAEETLEFRLITMTVSETSLDAPNIEGHSVGSAKYTGVAVFNDGRIAHKQFVGIGDHRGAEGNFWGYSTYTFLNGDSLSLKYTGGWGSDGFVGNYEVLSGTGAYEGATGTGHFNTAKNPWEKANLYDVTITVMTPDGS